MFQSLSIERFRGLSKLDLENLGRVNLIVGKNNTGKTSLLEAIALVADPERIKELPKLFRSFDPDTDERTYEWVQQRDTGNTVTEIVGGGNRIQIEKNAPPPPSPYSGSMVFLQPYWHWRELTFSQGTSTRAKRISINSVEHRPPEDIVDAFAKLMRSPDYELQLESLLAAVDKRIRSPRIDVTQQRPFIAVDVGLRERIPLSQAGQGVYRLVSIFSELLGNKPQICIIDEIENGIHYTALPTIWKGIAEVASRLDIQVFATTHSKECLEAAHEVFAAREPYDLRIIQLDRAKTGIVGRVFDRDVIEAGVEADIEMR